MGKKEKRDQKIRNNPQNLDFDEVLHWLKDTGFILERISGSHHIFRHPLTHAKLNFQPDKNGKAKSYQIKQAIRAIDQN